ncbi:SDR family oxidoreductase [Streptomyces sp. FH025]|uniref:SDR family oxidoreductase n=1 Tax=Streptomyces sp. FH025 TaxID=2815937 RepID=UPI001A9DD1A9|nr:SDR family oxidoreductase [Streptomyces sp. FH025]MBO1415824.1 SDR family oxidoreductase [Streptomyces sp. FH025]
MPLTGQHVVVLGGTSGIGLATATLAAERGARVTIASSRPANVERALSTLPAGTTAEVADLTDSNQVADLFNRLGPLDHLVYTAGEPLNLTTLDTLDLAAARDAFTLRYFGALDAVRAAAPKLRPGGSVTLTSGTAGLRPGPGWSIAASMCGAIEGLVRALAVELAPLRVNAVRAGLIRTPLWSGLPEADREEMYAKIIDGLPLGRIGEPEDAAEAYAYLMEQRYATGTVVTVDGGTLLA